MTNFDYSQLHLVIADDGIAAGQLWLNKYPDTKIKSIELMTEYVLIQRREKMKVYLVGNRDCESNTIQSVCATRGIAEKELFKARDMLINIWKIQDRQTQKFIAYTCKQENKPIWIDHTYKKMIAALSGNDYEQWDNYPHDQPYIEEMEVME